MERRSTEDYYHLLELIDESPANVTKWESDFIQSLLHERPGSLTANQKGVIERMAEKYLDGV